MSEDRPAAGEPAGRSVTDAPAGADAPAGEPADTAFVRPPRRRRLAILAAIGVAVIGAAIVVARWPRRDAAPATAPAIGDAGAAKFAPRGPSIPLAPDGVRLSGYAVDGAGAPVVGAEATAELERGASDRALSVTPSAGAGSAGAGSAGAGSAGAGAGAPARGPVAIAAPTGRDGKFVLEGLVPGRYRIRVTGPGLVPAEVRYVPVPSDEARIVVARQVQIDGTVADGTTPVANAIVGLRGDPIGGGIETRSDAAGAFHFPDLPEGRYQLYAWKGSLAARAIRVNRLGAGPFSPLALRLEAAAIVVGRVIDRDEGTGLGAAIELRASGDDQAPRYARSGDDGLFRIEGVPNGRWIADAFVPGYTSPGGVELDAGRGISELALARGATIEGRVIDGDGRPVAGATVRSLGSSGPASGSGVQEQSAEVDQDRLRRYSGRMAAPTAPIGVASADPQLIPRGELGVLVGPIPPIPPPGATIALPATIDPTVGSLAAEPAPLLADPARASIWTTGPDGRYRIRGVAKGKTSVLVVAPGFAEGRSKQLVVDAGQVLTDVDIVVTPGTIVIGKVTDQHGVPISGAQLSARPEVGAPVVAFAEADGTYKLGPVTGTIELVGSAYGHADARRTIELAIPRGTAVARGPAERREDLVLVVADAILAGTLDDTTGAAVAAGQLEVVGGAGDGRHGITASDGTFSIEMLPEGPVRVRVTHPDYPPAELDTVAALGGKRRARLRLPLGGAVEGALLDRASGAPLAGLAIDGDGPGTATAEATTDRAGRWKLGPLAPGHWKLVVQQPGYVPATRELDVPASRTPGATSVRDVRIELALGALVGGTIRDARGQRVAGAKVTVQTADGTGPVAEGVSDGSGEFRVRDAPTGELVVTATRGDARGATRATVRAGDEVLGLSIELR